MKECFLSERNLLTFVNLRVLQSKNGIILVSMISRGMMIFENDQLIHVKSISRILWTNLLNIVKCVFVSEKLIGVRS